MEHLTKPGQYRVRIIDYGLKEERSGSVAVTLKAVVTASPGDRGWVDCEQQLVEGSIYVIIRNGNELSERNAKGLMDHCGWDGNFESVVAKTWQPKPCSCEVKEEMYNNKTQIKITFINGFDTAPAMGLERARELQQKFGSSLHALGGSLVPSDTLFSPEANSAMPAPDLDIPF